MALGYDIQVDLGDQFSDLTGGFTDEIFELPNPNYFLPWLGGSSRPANAPALAPGAPLAFVSGCSTVWGFLPGVKSRCGRDRTSGLDLAAWKEADMAPVDVKRAFHSMTLPPPSGTAHEWPAPIPVEEVGGVAIPIGEEPDQPECGELNLLGEEDSQVRQVVELLAVILHQRPQPLSLVMDLLSCTLDLPPGCAAGLFWRAQEHGYVSLRHGIVHLDRLPLRQ